MFKAERDDKREFIPLSFFIIAMSDTRTLEDDTSGQLLAEMIEADGHHVVDRAVIPDVVHQIRNRIEGIVTDPHVDVIITTGGTGFTGRDVTPEAIEPLFDKRMEGFSVLFHQYSAGTVGTSTIQSRATAGLIGKTFVFCLPGSRGACRDAWQGILRHQLDYRTKPCNFVEIMPRLQEHLKHHDAEAASS
ncbi:MAG TPA: molybdenum cofactor biosynthesis protein B [Devosiaceae bacterium]|jgi:molybdenum cofactor biosynthesis protein B